ncbi:MAG: hypothetical protein SFT81_03380 [Candidatus Caenarcaniphilales bacterium]|nr:hypothetical protein [Candidatus Caenarcaniphilales bacterium]
MSVISLILPGELTTRAAEMIGSDWVSEGEKAKLDKKPVSATELEQFEAKVKALEEKKAADQRSMELEMADISARRSVLLDCMSDKGVMLFSIDNCAACKKQREYFGEDFKRVKYVNCDKNTITCPLRGISIYPTWYLGNTLGLKKKGVLDLPTLGKLTGCGW